MTSDYALAKRLKVTTSRFGNWRAGRSLPDTGIAVQLAEICELDELKVIADIELERGSNDELWARIAKRTAAGVAGLLVLALASYLTGDLEAGFNISQIASADPAAWALAPLLALNGPEIHIVSIALALALAWTTLRPWLIPRGHRTP